MGVTYSYDCSDCVNGIPVTKRMNFYVISSIDQLSNLGASDVKLFFPINFGVNVALSKSTLVPLGKPTKETYSAEVGLTGQLYLPPVFNVNDTIVIEVAWKNNITQILTESKAVTDTILITLIVSTLSAVLAVIIANPFYPLS